MKKFKSDFPKILIVFAIVIGMVCLIGISLSTYSFITTQVEYREAYNHTSAKIDKYAAESLKVVDAKSKNENFENQQKIFEKAKENTEQAIHFLERMEKAQENASSNSVMAFIYSVLSGVLVSLCAGFVATSYKNLNKVKAMTEEAEKIAKRAKSSSKATFDQVKKAKKNATEAKQKSDKAAANADKAEDEAAKAKQQYEKAKKEQNFFLEVLRILITISDARLALSNKKKAEATDRITEIEKLTCNLHNANNKQAVTQLRDELLRLDSSVDDYKDYIEDCNTSKERKDNDLVAVERYRKQIDNAVKHCDRLIAEAEKA